MQCRVRVHNFLHVLVTHGHIITHNLWHGFWSGNSEPDGQNNH